MHNNNDIESKSHEIDSLKLFNILFFTNLANFALVSIQ
jgi:hypothetical protein